MLASLAQSTGGRERLDLGEVWSTLPRQPRFVQLSVWLVITALVLFLLEVLQRRTGIFHFGSRTAPAVGEEVEVSTTPLKRRKTIAQAGPTGKEEREQKKVFRAPKPKRKHREARPDDAPPVVAPPMMENTPEAPPVINPNAGNTLDAMSQARQRARNRGGKPDEQ